MWGICNMWNNIWNILNDIWNMWNDIWNMWNDICNMWNDFWNMWNNCNARDLRCERRQESQEVPAGSSSSLHVNVKRFHNSPQFASSLAIPQSCIYEVSSKWRDPNGQDPNPSTRDDSLSSRWQFLWQYLCQPQSDLITAKLELRLCELTGYFTMIFILKAY